MRVVAPFGRRFGLLTRGETPKNYGMYDEISDTIRICELLY